MQQMLRFYELGEIADFRDVLLSHESVLQCSNVAKLDELGVEIAVIALPALLALASDPLASLVDTAFIGHLGTHSHIKNERVE